MEAEVVAGPVDQALLETGIEPPPTGLVGQAAGVNPAVEVESEQSDPVFVGGNYVTTDVLERLLNSFASSIELRMTEMMLERANTRSNNGSQAPSNEATPPGVTQNRMRTPLLRSEL